VAHEDFAREHAVEQSSDRGFALVFAAAFALIGAWPLLHAAAPRWWAVALAAACALIGWLRPSLLTGANRAWSALGVALGRLVTPLVLGLLFYGVLAPMGILMRLAGKDPLRLRVARRAASHWLTREPPGPPPDSMGNQF
jgi:hypothetical protein